jgi:hypothetical protein
MSTSTGGCVFVVSGRCCGLKAFTGTGLQSMANDSNRGSILLVGIVMIAIVDNLSVEFAFVAASFGCLLIISIFSFFFSKIVL